MPAKIFAGIILYQISHPHKNRRIANITIVLKIYAVTIAAVLLIFPNFLKLRFLYDKSCKKMFFAVHIDKIRILGGYAERIKEGFAFHISEKKAFIMPYRSLIGMKSNFNLRKDYFIREIKFLTELGSEKFPQIPFMFAVASNILTDIYGAVRNSEEIHTEFRNDVLLYENENVLKISAEIEVVFNLLTILITLSKLLLRKIENGLRK